MTTTGDPSLIRALPAAAEIAKLPGPVLVLGASGFVGANLFRALIAHRDDVYGTATQLPAWRLEGVRPDRQRAIDLLVEPSVDALLAEVQPRTVFNCIAYGGYSFETDANLIYQTNFVFAYRLIPKLIANRCERYVHAGSSSEYGDHAAAPGEESFPRPNSHYAVAKLATAQLIHFYGKHKAFPCVNLRLYSVYGPLEDASRLIPTLIAEGAAGRLPPLVSPKISRDLIYVDDAVAAFVAAAVQITPADYGDSFNIGTGVKTTIGELAELARELFHIEASPQFAMAPRDWDVNDWFADPAKANERLQWQAHENLRDGLTRTIAWYHTLTDAAQYQCSSRKLTRDTRHSVSAIVACYRDGQAIPIMYDRLRATFTKLNVDWEIIFVNDRSPDEAEEVIRQISGRDRHVIGISHSRNFGSQAAFASGMAIASMNSCVLLDGDLQDPPELIESFVQQWKAGYDVVFGRRVKRDAPWHMQVAYKAFYRVFDFFSYVRIPHDAGDFALLDRRVVQSMLKFPERDLFLRGVRAYAGFKQIGVDYIRPERMFGVTTNSLRRNFWWAKKGILSFSNVPLGMLTFTGVTLSGITLLLMLVQALSKLLSPNSAPHGVTTILLVASFFGSINLLGIAVLGEYLAKIFEEVKQRPLYIRRSIVRDGEIRPADQAAVRRGQPGSGEA